MPKTDIRKRKNMSLDMESVIMESSQVVTAACSALPALLSSTTSKPDTEEEKGMVTVLLHGIKRVPMQQRTKCLIKLLEILESFQHE